MSRTVQTAITTALNNAPAKNFINGDDAKNIAAAAKADGKVTAEEIKAVNDLNLSPTFFSDDLFEGGGRDWNFDKPTASGNGFGQLAQFVRENSMKEAVDHALRGQGFLGFNFIDTQDAKNIVAAAKADGKIDAEEKKGLEALHAGWTYWGDADGNKAQPMETPTLSITAGSVIHKALQEAE